ncbi:unnamed protein product [Clonostachys rosea f. rosea IK726]|uniref:Uncharacterized protein n=1 Tax=Clonostachys rosea f. rosea IK726 TaxID=1349383 RepID=A0ACA9UMX3_BIOOC|nr:unnamed protein product [Clonostachys rosea f. rosea IK726]
MYKPLAVQLLFSSAMLVTALWPRFEYPEEVPALERRQEPGTPRYQCHEDCGLLITLGRQDGYCNNSEWNERYGRCMICANTFGIWEYYGNSVTKAAKGCGLSPTPSPSGTTASSTSAGEPSTTAAGKTSTSTAPGQTSAIKTSSAAQTTGQSGSAVTSNAASTAGQISNASTLSTASTRASGPGVSSGPSSTPVTPPRPSGSSVRIRKVLALLPVLY